MAADEPAGPPPATAKSKSYRGLAGFITSLKYHLEKREAGNFFEPLVYEEYPSTLLGRMLSIRSTGTSNPISRVAYMSHPSARLRPAQSEICVPQSTIEGAGSRIRTDDLLITNQLLYQLSYAGAYPRRIG